MRGAKKERVVIRASSSDANPTRNSTSSSTSKVSEDDESFTLADVGEDSTLAEKRNEFQEAIAKAQMEQKRRRYSTRRARVRLGSERN